MLPVVKMPCILHDVFHIYCPGCGGTRAVMALLHLQIGRSLQLNPFALLFLLYGMYLLVHTWVFARKEGTPGGESEISNRKEGTPDRKGTLPGKILVVLIVLFFLYGIFRDWLLLARHIDLVGDFVKCK